jgi:hypothetical protein
MKGIFFNPIITPQAFFCLFPGYQAAIRLISFDKDFDVLAVFIVDDVDDLAGHA